MFRSLTTKVLTTIALATATAGAFVLPGSPANAVISPGSWDAPTTWDKPTIHGTTKTGPDVYLHNLRLEQHYKEQSELVKSPSRELSPDTSDEWQLKSSRAFSYGAVEISLKYEIFDGANKPTGFWVHANFRMPAVGSNHGQCWIVRDTTDQTGPTALEAPYTCVWKGYSKSSYAPRPILEVNAPAEVETPAEIEKILAEYCSEQRENVRCTPTNATFSSFLGIPIQASGEYRNLSNSDVVRPKAWQSLTIESGDIPVTAGFDAAFGDFKANMAALHGRTWVPSMEKSGTADLPVPARSTAWFMYSPAMQAITTDWLVTTGEKAWLLRGVTFTGPNPHGRGMLTTCSADLNDRNTNNTCADLITKPAL